MRDELISKIIEGQEKGIINLGNCGISDSEIEEITAELSKNSLAIKVINLDNNNLTDAGAQILATHLSHFHQLNELGLQFNNIDKAGAVSVFSLKREHPELRILFHGNRIKNAVELMEIEQHALQRSNPSL